MPDADITSDFIPNGFDRADGLDGHPGTAIISDRAILIQSDQGVIPFEESPDSPVIERGETATIQHSFIMAWEDGEQAISVLERGTILGDDNGNISRVLTARLTHVPPFRGRLEVTAEGLNFDSPVDEYRLEPVEINPSIYKHPRYAVLTDEDRNLVRNAIESSTLQSQAVAQVKAANLTGLNWDVRQEAATELIKKLWKGEDTFYMVGMKIVWSRFYFLPQPIDPGGRIENPVNGAHPALDPFFWDTLGDGTASYLDGSIFAQMGDVCPQLYFNFDVGLDISWLRQHDESSFDRTWFRHTRSWIGAPFSHWDADLYSPGDNPYLPTGNTR